MTDRIGGFQPVAKDASVTPLSIPPEGWEVVTTGTTLHPIIKLEPPMGATHFITMNGVTKFYRKGVSQVLRMYILSCWIEGGWRAVVGGPIPWSDLKELK